MLSGTNELWEILEDIRKQLEEENIANKKFKIANYADAQRELVARSKLANIINKRPSIDGETNAPK